MSSEPQESRRQALERYVGGEATIVDLSGGHASISAKTPDGEVLNAEVVNSSGVEVSDGLGLIGQQRREALARVDLLTDHVIDHLEAQIRNGGPLNVSEAERTSGITRRTIYTRLEKRGVKPSDGNGEG